MKLNKIFFAALSIAAIAFASCEHVPEIPDGPGNNPGGKDTTNVTPTDTAGWVVPADANIPEGTLTVAQAREICAALEDKAVTSEKYYVKGFVKKLGNKHADGVANYGNGTFYMVDEKDAKDDFEAYQVYGLEGNKLVSADQVEVGDYVVVYGPLTNYGGTYETAGQGKAYIYWSSNPKIGEKPTVPNPEDATEVTIAQAIEIASALNAGSKTTEAYKLTNVIVDTIFTNAAGVTQYGNINLRVKDAEGNSISCYYTNNIGNVKFTSADQCPKVGATVSLVGPLKNYAKGETTTPEFENAWFTAISETEAPAGGNTGGGNTGGGTTDGGTTTLSGDTLGVSVAEGAITLTFAIGSDIDIKASRTFALGETGYTLTLDGSANTSSGTKIVGTGNYPQFRMYKGTTFTVTAPAGQNITSIDIYTEGTVSGKDYSGANLSIVSGEGTLSINAADAKISNWVGSANAVCFTNNNQVRINKLVIK